MTNRFVTPAIPLLLILAALGFARLRESGAKRPVQLLAGALAALGLVHLLAALTPGSLPHLPYMPYGGAISRPDVVQSIGLLLVAGAVSVALKHGRDARLVWPLVAIALVVATAGDQIDQWRTSGAAYSDADAAAARFGVNLRRATPRNTTVAVVWAGPSPSRTSAGQDPFPHLAQWK